MQILVIDAVHVGLLEGLKALGHKVAYEPLMGRSELIRVIGRYEGLVVRTKTSIDREVLSQARALKFIGRAGAGVDNIDTNWCDANGINYFNAGEANADAVGEQAVGMLLSLLAHIGKSDDEVRRRIWDREGNTGIELKGRTVGIIGYGNTGKAFARKLSGFEARVIAYDKYLEDYSDAYATQVTIDQIMEQAEVVSFHVPLTRETTRMGNAAFFKRFKHHFWLLNLSRGGVVNLEALVNCLKSRKILGAGLDVLENEKLDQLSPEEQERFEYLIQSTDTVLTPHIGGWTKESYQKIGAVLLQRIKELG